MISGSVSLPCSGFFSPFPHGTGPLSVSREYLALRDGPRGFTPDFSCPALLRCRLGCLHRFRVRGLHPLRPQFPLCSPSLPMCLRWRSYNPGGRRNDAGLGSCAFARHYLRNHCCFLLLRVLRCFSSPGSPPRQCADAGIASGGLPHSEIRGSTGICPSPRLIAACHVLLRLREPRHPSCALISFPFFSQEKSPFFIVFFALTSYFRLP